jgi:phosphoenolpyruvate carboxykinase (ATP)
VAQPVRPQHVHPSDAQERRGSPRFTVIHAPDFKADPDVDGARTSECSSCSDFTRRLVLIGGTSYAGEIRSRSSPR